MSRRQVILIADDSEDIRNLLGVMLKKNYDIKYAVNSDETLSAIAEEHYRHADEWRRIADANGLEDPRRLTPGVFLKLPPIL